MSVLSFTNVDTTGRAGLDESFDHTQQIPSPCIYDVEYSSIDQSSMAFIITLRPGNISCF